MNADKRLSDCLPEPVRVYFGGGGVGRLAAKQVAEMEGVVSTGKDEPA